MARCHPAQFSGPYTQPLRHSVIQWYSTLAQTPQRLYFSGIVISAGTQSKAAAAAVSVHYLLDDTSTRSWLEISADSKSHNKQPKALGSSLQHLWLAKL